jgi:hypothetical protein
VSITISLSTAELSLEGDFDFAAHAIGWECEFNGTAEFIGNEIADELLP